MGGSILKRTFITRNVATSTLKGIVYYLESFPTKFLGHKTFVQVSLPLSISDPKATVTISVENATLTIDSDIFDRLFQILISMREHTNLLIAQGVLDVFSGKQTVLRYDEESIRVGVLRTNNENRVAIRIQDVIVADRELNDKFLLEFKEFIAFIEKSKKQVAEKVKAHVNTL